MDSKIAPIYVIMGVSGSGKTSVGTQLASKLGLPFLDADNFHPESNLQKMSAGQALTDQDRWPWLQILNKQLINAQNSKGAVLACSALKESYRRQLSQGLPVNWVVLTGTIELIQKRMQDREHFMPISLLKSQFETLELPSYGLHLDISLSLPELVSQIIKKPKASFGIIGLGVMGRSLALNALSKSIPTAVYNRTQGIEAQIIPNFEAHCKSELLFAHTNLKQMVQSMSSPRKLLLMVPAGNAVDAVIDQLVPLLNANDIIIDGGNSFYKDTQRRFSALNAAGLHFVGLGVSGGEQGALNGPALMPGGNPEVIDTIKELKLLAANFNNQACAQFMGENGAGHFVKMIHNGIEYVEMQLLAELYSCLKEMGKENDQIASIFKSWQQSSLNSYLLGITAKILEKKEAGKYLLDLIKDEARGKGTGTWSAQTALEHGVAATMITAAVMARTASSKGALRQELSNLTAKNNHSFKLDIEALKEAYHLARLINHIQGFELIITVAQSEKWQIDLKKVAHNWSEGCILKSDLIRQIASQYDVTKALERQGFYLQLFKAPWDSLTQLCAQGALSQLALPCFNAGLTALINKSTPRSNAAIIQAQRDYFGAHTYKRIDKPDSEDFHTNWTQS